MNIADILHRHASTFGDRVAIAEAARSVTYRQLDAQAAAVAEDLAGLGLSAGMRALVFCPMSIPLYATLVGLFRLHVAAVFVDPSAGRERLADAVQRLCPDAFLGTTRAH